MEYNSFYGGRKGASFIIVARFNTIAAMVTEFKKGGEYKDVNYDEYVIIDTENKNNRDNGKIYRRGYDFNNNMGGAILIGQIVGPSGPAPLTSLTSVEEVNRISTAQGNNANTQTTRGTVEVVPGAKGNATQRTFDDETDKVYYAAVSVRDTNSNDSKLYIGFKFPYMVTDFISESVSPYQNGTYQDKASVERVDDTQHKFYQKWKITIPKGVKGDTFKNLKVVTASADIEDYTGKQDDITNNRKVLVYEYYNYDTNENGTPKKIYLGDYNMVRDITLSDDGTIQILYEHNNTAAFTKAIKWIKSVELNGTTGQFTVTYNHDQDKNGHATAYTSNLRFVNGIEVANDGSIKVKYTTGGDVTLPKKINYVQKTAIDNRYHLLVYYSDPAMRAAATTKATYSGQNDWTDLGYIGNGTGTGAIVGKENDAAITAVANALPPYSTWFIVEGE